MQAGEAALAIQQVKNRKFRATQQAAATAKLAADAAEQAAAQLLQEEAKEAEAAQRCKDRKQKAAGKKARQKQRKQVRLGCASRDLTTKLARCRHRCGLDHIAAIRVGQAVAEWSLQVMRRRKMGVPLSHLIQAGLSGVGLQGCHALSCKSASWGCWADMKSNARARKLGRCSALELETLSCSQLGPGMIAGLPMSSFLGQCMLMHKQPTLLN